jgi:hypothetical protein
MARTSRAIDFGSPNDSGSGVGDAIEDLAAGFLRDRRRKQAQHRKHQHDGCAHTKLSFFGTSARHLAKNKIGNGSCFEIQSPWIKTLGLAIIPFQWGGFDV